MSENVTHLVIFCIDVVGAMINQHLDDLAMDFVLIIFEFTKACRKQHGQPLQKVSPHVTQCQPPGFYITQSQLLTQCPTPQTYSVLSNQ